MRACRVDWRALTTPKLRLNERENRPADALGLARVRAARRGCAANDRCARREGKGDQPPVTLMWRVTAGFRLRRAMTRSWPVGLCRMAASIAALRRSLLADARSGARRSAASSWPRHM